MKHKEALGSDLRALLDGSAELGSWPADRDENSAVPDYEASPLLLEGQLHKPILDEVIVDKHGIDHSWPCGKEFAACLTHDLDHAHRGSLVQVLRYFFRAVEGKWVTNNLRLAALEAYYWMSCIGKADRFDCLDDWLALEREKGVRSTFFVMTGHTLKSHFSDPGYELTDEVRFGGNVVRLCDALKQVRQDGWEIGLHPSWYTYGDAASMRSEKQKLETAIDCAVRSVRQHFLHFDFAVTPRVQIEAGFEFDSSLGFNRTVGFRNGTSWPFALPAGGADEHPDALERGVLEIPLIVQDVALLGTRRGLGLGGKRALELIDTLSDRVRAVHGVITLSWHTNVWHNEPWREVYEAAVEMLQSKGAWFGTVAEVGDHWRNHAENENGKCVE